MLKVGLDIELAKLSSPISMVYWWLHRVGLDYVRGNSLLPSIVVLHLVNGLCDDDVG